MGWGFNAAKVMEMVVVQGGSQKHAKLQSDHRHPNTITRFFTSRMPFLYQQCESTKGEICCTDRKPDYWFKMFTVGASQSAD